MQRISVIGLGKLGACTATAFASRGFDVIGVDIFERTVDQINQGVAPVQEPNLQEMISANHKRLSATTSYHDAVLNSDATFIIVQTPSDDLGGFSVAFAQAACKEIGRALAQKDGYHLVVMVSTVLPGATEAHLLPILEEESGKRCGEDFGLCYSPEFIALGSVLYDFLHPHFALVGEFDSRSGDLLTSIYQHTLGPDVPICRMNIVSAEVTKLSVNTFVTTKISFANMLTQLCDLLPGASIDAVTGAMGKDPRIGARYLTGGVSYGGPCFPRDNVALKYLADSVGVNASIAESTHQYNLAHREWLFHRVVDRTAPGGAVGVIGLAYRPSTPIIEQAAGMDLVIRLVAAGYRVIVSDQWALDPARHVLADSVVYAASAEECVDQADTVVLVSQGEDVASIPAEAFVGGATRRTVIDCWRVRKDLASQPDLRYVGLGTGMQAEFRTNRTLSSVN